MAEQITKWRAKDGQEFATEAEARAQDALVDAVDDIMAPLGPDCLLKSNVQVQHDPEVAFDCKKKLLLLGVKTMTPARFERYSKRWLGHKDNSDLVAIMRRELEMLILDELPLRHAWARLRCIDAWGREWHQMSWAVTADPPGAEPKG